MLPEVGVLMGEVPVVPYATTGTPALGDAVEPFLEGHEAVLLANHGALAWGADLATRPHPDGKPGARGPDSPGRPKPRPGDPAHPRPDARPRAAERKVPSWPNRPRILTRPSKALLQQRAQYEQWLARLDSAGDKAPPAVRARVRSDYEARLRGVIDQLRGHAATIAEELDRHKGTQTGLDGERRQAEEELAEAEVRHAVGEYSEDEWQRISDQSGELLGRLRGELRGGRGRDRAAGGSAGADRRRAEARRAAAAAPPPPPPPVAAAPEPEPEPERFAPPPAAPSPRPGPRPGRAPREPEITHGPPPVDEMAFLKSVAPEEERKPAPPPPAAAPRQQSRAGAGQLGRRESAGERRARRPPRASRARPGVAKTLKCGECGTLNRPTEWYCERCGAELAGI